MQQRFQHHHFPAPDGRPTWLLLAALEHRPKDVAQVLESIEQQTGIIYEPATLNRWIVTLERRGWIERGESDEDRSRYRITVIGEMALYGQDSHDHSNAKVYEPKKRRRRVSGVKENLMRLVIWMVQLYPPAWRERYEAEMRGLLELHTITLFTVIDLFFGAINAWLDPHYRRTNLRLLRLRIHAAVVLLGVSLGLFLFAAIGWIGVIDISEPADLDHLATALSPFASGILALIGEFSLKLAFSSLAIVPFLVIGTMIIQVIIQVSNTGKAHGSTPFLRCIRLVRRYWWHLFRLLPAALALFLFSVGPRTWWIPSWLGVVDWGVYGSFLLILVDGAIEVAVSLLSAGKTWLEHNGSRLVVPVCGAMVIVCTLNIIWMRAVWQLIPRVEAAHPSWQWQIWLLIQLAFMVLATILALLAVVLSLGVSRRLRENRSSANTHQVQQQ